jgi:hypothetical protein
LSSPPPPMPPFSPRENMKFMSSGSKCLSNKVGASIMRGKGLKDIYLAWQTECKSNNIGQGVSWLTNGALVYEPKCGGGVAGLSHMSTAVHMEPKYSILWRSNSII